MKGSDGFGLDEEEEIERNLKDRLERKKENKGDTNMEENKRRA